MSRMEKVVGKRKRGSLESRPEVGAKAPLKRGKLPVRLPLDRLSKLIGQQKIGWVGRKILVRAFQPGSPEWEFLGKLDLPSSLPGTCDPFLLALRTLASNDFGRLGARHRFAAESAPLHPLGLLSLALEEAALVPIEGEPIPIFGVKKALVDLWNFLPQVTRRPGSEAVHDLNARFFGQVARSQAAYGLWTGASFVAAADTLLRWGSGDSDLQVFLEEVRIADLEASGRVKDAAARYAALLEEPLRLSLEPDRRAELLVGYARLILRHKSLKRRQLRPTIKAAAAIMQELPSHFNQPLRSELAELVTLTRRRPRGGNVDGSGRLGNPV